jgi:hypothetical protein
VSGTSPASDRNAIERLDGFEIVDNDEDVVHPFKRHILPSLASLLMPVLAARGQPDALKYSARGVVASGLASGAAPG